MTLKKWILAGLLSTAVLAVPASMMAHAALNAAAVAPVTFKVDNVHSTVLFRITHLGVGAQWGRFNDPSGTIVQTGDDVALNVSIDVTKVDTDNESRDGHIRGGDFFNVAQFPTATFVSKSSKKLDEKTWEVTGDFTLKGVTKSITVKLDKIGEKEIGGQFGYRNGYETTFTINRLDYDISWKPELLGTDVKLIVALEGIRQ
jgi:polyisoprenoid-binding protein YceI